MEKLSIIIPSFCCQYVSNTIDDIFLHAKEDIEVIVVLDGYCPDTPIEERDNLIIIQNETNIGMRRSINKAVMIAQGKYIMKCDDHCAFSDGFDIPLKQYSLANQISIPSRYSLDVVNWKTRWWPVDYEYMAYPYVYHDSHRYGIGLYAKKWLGDDGIHPKNMGVSEFYKKERKLANLKIDDIMIFLGACWFTEKVHFEAIGGLDEQIFKTLYQEPQELSFKTWLSGGRVIVNKYAWYAHMFKGKNFGDAPNIRGYKLNLGAMRETERFGSWYWMNNQWGGAIKPMKWLIEKFWPIPGWPEDWEKQKIDWEKAYPINN